MSIANEGSPTEVILVITIVERDDIMWNFVAVRQKQKTYHI